MSASPLNVVEMLLQAEQRSPHAGAHLRKVDHQFSSLTFSSFVERVFRIAQTLTGIGIRRGDAVAIIGESSSDWAAADLAILSIGAVSVPVYPTSMPDTVGYILRDSNAKAAFAGEPRLAKKIEEAGIAIPVLFLEDKHVAPSELNRERWVAGIQQIQPDDIATIIYTSGTTGEPKGAVLTHKAFVFQCEAIRKNLPVGPTDRFFCLLPLSHVYARIADHYLPLFVGAEVAFPESLKTLSHDIQETKPTIVPAVPRFLEMVYTKILSSMDDAPAWKKWLFQKALATGKSRLKRPGCKPVGLFGSITDALVGKKVREKFGGRVRFFVSGGAALSSELAEFYASFGLPIVQGYGLTETAPVISINHPDRNDPHSVGEVLEGVSVRIADDGEILMQGPNLMLGYHNKPEETANAIDREGWFHTGDIGMLRGNRLFITDRKKDILVLSNGKNVAPAHIEGRLKSSKYIDEAMVIGDGMDHVAALIVPAFEAVRHFCHAEGLDTSHQCEVAELPAVQQLIRKEIETINQTLADYEKVRGHRILTAAWTQETGELTPSMKVRRPYVKQKFSAEIAELMKR